MTTRDLFAALAAVVIWGINFVAMKHSLHDFTPFQLGAARFAFAALPLVFFMKRPRLPVRWLVFYGLSQGLGQFGFLFVALQVGMTASLGSVLMQTQVFFTTLLGAVLLKERIGRPLRIGLLLAAAGIGCFALNFVVGRGNTGGITLLGLALVLCAATMWGVSNIVARKVQAEHPDYDAMSFVVWSSCMSVVPFILLSLVFDAPELRWRWLHASLGSWVGAAFLGWVATSLAYGLWAGLFKRYPANRVAPFSLGVPVVGLAAGMGLLGEHVTAWQWTGIAFVVAALGVVMFGGRLWRAMSAAGA